MTADRLLLIPLAVGHLALFVLATNVTHGLGIEETASKKVKILLVFTFSAITALIGFEAWQGAIHLWSWPSLVYAVICVGTALVALPASTALLHGRTRLPDLVETSTEIDIASRFEPGSLVGQGSRSWLLRIPGNDSFRLRKVEWTVTIAGLPRSLDGLSILHITDTHFSPAYDRRFFEAVFEEAGAWPANIVAFTGDLVDSDEAAEWVVPLFSRVQGQLGSFAILGNHDLTHQPNRLRSLLTEAGYTDLEASWATIESPGGRIVLGGTSYPWGLPLPMAEQPRAGDLRILLSHSPDEYYRAEQAGFQLMLSGHNHGGQVRLPVLGPVFMPSRYSRRFDRGFFRRDGLTLHVSQGVAAKDPIRIGCVPEIGRIVLRSPVIVDHEPDRVKQVRRASESAGRSVVG